MSALPTATATFRFSALPVVRAAAVAEGREIEPVIERLFANGDAACVHVHNARPGCYSCRIDRA